MREDIDAVIEPIVEAAQIPSHRRRDELRRELRSHFEECGVTSEALHDAVARFGNTARIADSFRTVYRRDYMLLYTVKVGACIAAATMAAILIEAIASLRLESGADAWHLSPGFAHAAPYGVVLTLALVADDGWTPGRISSAAPSAKTSSARAMATLLSWSSRA